MELSENTTTEEISDFIDTAIAEVEEERTSDAEVIASETDTPVGDHTNVPEETETPIETETDSSDDDAGEESMPTWLDDDLKTEVAAYSIDDKTLAEFGSREELERAMRLFDRTALDAGRKEMAESEGKEETPEPTKAEPAKSNVGLDRDVFDDDLVDAFENMQSQYETRLEALEARLLDVDAQAEEQKFDNLVDSLGHADLFGKTGKENSKQLQRRQDLIVAVKAQQIGLKTLGRTVDLDESLVNRVAKMVFSEDINKKELKARTRSISQQANGRQGGGVTRPTDAPEEPREEWRRKFKELHDA